MIMDDFVKSIKDINPYANVASSGLVSDVKSFLDTGSYVFNALVSGSIFGGIASNRITGIAGPQSAGKTYLAVGICELFLANNKDSRVLYFDSEHAIETKMLENRNIDLKRFWHLPIESLNDFQIQINKIIELIKQYNNKYDDIKPNNFIIILDSLGMIPSNKEIKDALSSEPKGDLGLRSKQIKSIFRSITLKLGVLNIPMFVTTHTYDKPGSFFPETGVSGGGGLGFACSIIIELMKPKKQKEGKDVFGVFLRARVKKSRISREFKEVSLSLHFRTGLDRYYGLLDIAKTVIRKDGRKYIFPNGERLYEREVMSDPTKYFTISVLRSIDVEVQKEFAYYERNLECVEVGGVNEKKSVSIIGTIIKEEPGNKSDEDDILEDFELP